MKRTLLFAIILHCVHSQLNCTDFVDDACEINTFEISTDNYIRCSQDPSYPNCIVNCNGEKYCGDDNPDDDPQIVCPHNGDTCIINCNTFRACAGASVDSNNCSYVEINMYGDQNKRMNIYAPGNGGTLLIQLKSSSASFDETFVYAKSDTANITILCNGGGGCSTNEFYAETMMEHGNGVFNFECDVNGGIGICDAQKIYCPTNQIGNTINDTNCNINCEGDCTSMIVYAIEGEHDVTWKCDGTNSQACKTGKLKCDAAYVTTANYGHSAVDELWTLAANCDITPTDAPSPSPTYDPTNEPTTEPTNNLITDEPTINPTVEPTFVPTNRPTDDPTTDPTDPTDDPTYDPTTDPSIDPTEQPTTEPTNDPTEPTFVPSDEPTTNYPTRSPSFEPTYEPPTTHTPTSKPTEMLIVPTVAPSFDLTLFSSSTMVSTKGGKKGSGSATDGTFIEMSEWQWLVLLMIAMFFVFCIICLCAATVCACFFHFRHVSDMEQNLATLSVVQSGDSSRWFSGESTNDYNNNKLIHMPSNNTRSNHDHRRSGNDLDGENETTSSDYEDDDAEYDFSDDSTTMDGAETKPNVAEEAPIAMQKLAPGDLQIFSNADSRVNILDRASPSEIESDLSNFY